MTQNRFELRVELIKSVCSFQLVWGDRNRQESQLHFPDKLHHAYIDWQAAYDDYYKHFSGSNNRDTASEDGVDVRGKVVSKGTVHKPVDRRLTLVQTEAGLLDIFKQWLRSEQLYSLRNVLLQAVFNTQQLNHDPKRVEVFLTATPAKLARLPWEIWDLGSEVNFPGAMQIIRTPSQIKPQTLLPQHSQIRLLAILGDDSGLDFTKDKDAIRSLEPKVKVEFEGWRGSDDNASDVKQRICQAIENEAGWDVLFFAGHSNESELVGGEIAIAPNVGITAKELTPFLSIARQRGLKLAIFNSCKGVDIAEALINLGLHQVIVMRERIHDAVAPRFLKHFARALTTHQDCLDAVQAARTALKKNLDFKSADLVPSLFAHPATTWFAIPQTGLKYQLRRRLPTWREAVSLGGLILMGLLPPAQDLLIDIRVYAQALYRQATAQIPPPGESPVTLVQIDSNSLNLADVQHRRPIDRGYLADLLATLTDLEAPVVGIDYILDDYAQQEIQVLNTVPENGSQQLQQAIQEAQSQDTQLVFGYYAHEDKDRGQISEALIKPELAVHGEINFFRWYLEMLPAAALNCPPPACPFAYQLALDFARTQSEPQRWDIDEVNDKSDLSTFRQSSQHWMETWEWLSQLQLPVINQFSTSFLQSWLHPILDFSIPPSVAYQKVIAHDLLKAADQEELSTTAIQNSVVIVAPGGYEEAGVQEEGQDNFGLPSGIQAWSNQERFTAGEAHAYMLHHFLTRHLVYPIPDVWLILLAAWLGKEVRIRFPNVKVKQQRQLWQWAIASGGYGVIGLQIYISAGILLPWLLPNLMFGRYLWLTVARGRND